MIKLIHALLLELFLPFVFLRYWVLAFRHSGNELFEIRIFEGAPAGTKATPNEAFTSVIKELKNCFAQIDTELEWIDFDPSKMIFETIAEVPSDIKSTHSATLHSMCPGNDEKTGEISFSIHVTRRNRHPPKFASEHFEFYVPITLKAGVEAGHVYVTDNDPIIYNSQIQLSIVSKQTDPKEHPVKTVSQHLRPLKSETFSAGVLKWEDLSHWNIHRNGSINIKKVMTDLQLYQPYTFRILAVDFGSPQLFSFANVTIIPVSVSQPQNVRVNTANPSYQVFEWDLPSYGVAEKFRLKIHQNQSIVYEKEIDPSEQIALTKLNLTLERRYLLTIAARDLGGETPSAPLFFSVHTEKPLNCEGECSPEAGSPICFYSKSHKLEQFRDRNGPHCLCYHGYSGSQCDFIETCLEERISNEYGTLEWPKVGVNSSQFLLCPFNTEREPVERRCHWDPEKSIAKWDDVLNEEKCKRQSSILVHLGVLASYVQRSDQSISGIQAVLRFLDSILLFPAFEKQEKNAQFDAKIAEHVVQLMDTLATGYTSETTIGNNSQISIRLQNHIKEFTRRIPVPYSLTSPTGGLHIRSWQLLDVNSREQNDDLNSRSSEKWPESDDEFYSIESDPLSVHFINHCFLRLPLKFSKKVLLASCIRNTTLLPSLDGFSPLFIIEAEDNNGRSKQSINRTTINTPYEPLKKTSFSQIRARQERYSGSLIRSPDHSIYFYNADNFDNTHRIDFKRKILLGLRLLELPPNYGTALNYTCAFYDYDEQRWSTSGVRVLHRNPSTNLILCESDFLASFAILPETMFESKNSVLFDTIPVVAAMGSAIMVISNAFLSMMINSCQKSYVADPAMNYLLLIAIVLHAAHLFTFVASFLEFSLPDITLIRKMGLRLDPDTAIYLILQFSLIAIAGSIAIINSSIHSRMAQIEGGSRHLASRCARSIVVFLFAGAAPFSVCALTWLFDSYIVCEITSKNPVLQKLDWPFIVGFLLPSILYIGFSSGYGAYSYYYGGYLISNTRHAILVEKQQIIYKLIRSTWLSLLVLLFVFITTLTLSYPYGAIRNMLLSLLYVLTSIWLTIFASLLMKIQKVMPNCQRGIIRLLDDRQANNNSGQNGIISAEKDPLHKNGFTQPSIADGKKCSFWRNEPNGIYFGDFGGVENHNTARTDEKSLDNEQIFLLEKCRSPRVTLVHPASADQTELALSNRLSGIHGYTTNPSHCLHQAQISDNNLKRLSQQTLLNNGTCVTAKINWRCEPDAITSERSNQDQTNLTPSAAANLHFSEIIQRQINSLPVVESQQLHSTTRQPNFLRKTAPPIAQFSRGAEDAEPGGDFENLDEFLDIQSISTSLHDTNDSLTNSQQQQKPSVPSPSPYSQPLISVV